MKLFNSIRNLFAKKKTPRRRGYAAAKISRLTSSLASTTEYINNTLRYELKLLRARSREQAQNNPLVKRFISLLVQNVCGPKPFRLQAKVKKANGKLDQNTNQRIEDGWREWGKQADITTRWKWNAFQRLVVRTLAIDGEVLIRKYRGPDFGRHGFQLQLIDIDRLDERRNVILPDGAIHMGVEVDGLQRPRAYHLLKSKPNDLSKYHVKEYEVIPADEIIHLYVPEFVEQIRGVPWIYAALLNINNIDGFSEAAIIAARIGAAQMGFLESPDSGARLSYDGEDERENPMIDAEPGIFPVLPPGYRASAWNPKYPDAAVEPFLKAMVRGVAAGVDLAYHNLSGDMSGVNYSSARIAELGEREHWKIVQDFCSDHFNTPVYDEWLSMAILMRTVPLNPSNIDRYRNIQWQAHTWQWVDPLKETQSKILAIDNNLTSRARVMAEDGRDIDDVFMELAEEKEKMQELGLKQAAPAMEQNDNDNEAQSNDEQEKEPATEEDE